MTMQDSVDHSMGALKMQDWKMTDHIAGVENDGPMGTGI